MISVYSPQDIPAAAAQLERWRGISREQVADLDSAFDREFRALMGRWFKTRPDGLRPIGGGAPSIVQNLARLDTDTAPVNNTFTSAQSIIGTAAAPGPRGPFSTDYFKTPGAHWRQEAHGIIGTTGTPTIIFGTYFGVADGSITTALCVTPTITTASALSNVPWYYVARGRTVSSQGSASTMLVMGILFGNIESLAATVAGEPIQYGVNATPPTAVTTDLSTAVYLDLKATWSASSASNTITVHIYTLESLYC